MGEMKELRKSIGFKNLKYHFKGKNVNKDFNDFFDAENLYNNKLKSCKIKLDD